MKIAIVIPTEPSRKRHIETILNGGIRVGGNKKTDIIFITSDVISMPLPKNFYQISYGEKTPFNRLIEFLFSKKALKYDIIFSCDDDSLTCTNGMHAYFEKNRCSEPKYWGGSPGHIHNDKAMPYGPILKNCICEEEKEKYKIRKNCFHGYESGAMNKSAILKLHKNKWVKKVLNCFSNIALEPNGSPLWASELVMRNIAYILDIHSQEIGPQCSMMPVFLDCKVLVNKSNQNAWHCHFTHNHSSLTHESLNNTLKNGPYRKVDKLVSDLFPQLKFSIDSEKFVNTKMLNGFFWMPYLNLGRNVPHPYPVGKNEKNYITLYFNYQTSKFFTWKPIKNGFEFIINKNIRHKYLWTYEDRIIVGTEYIDGKISAVMPCLFFK